MYATRTRSTERTAGNALAIAAIAVTCVAVAALIPGCAATPKEPTLTPQQRQLNLESFDYVWTTVHEKYWDPEFGGLDWLGIRDELRPQVEQSTSMSQSRGIMNDMISRLGVSHFAVIPTEVYNAIGPPTSKGAQDGATGIDVRVFDGQALVTAVVADSPAAQAGVRPGWIVARVGETDVRAKLELLTKEFEGKQYKDFVCAMAVQQGLIGSIGDTVTVQFLDGDDQVVEREMTLAEQRGRKVQLGNLPSLRVWIETDRLPGDIGYIAFNHFLDPAHVMPVFNDAMKSFMDAEGIVIDVRGNGGGIGGMAMGMAGWLVPEKSRYLGTLYLRDNELKLIVSPRAKTYAGPVAILADGLSGSAAEFFAGGLQDLDRACIVGSRTIGAALPSIIEKLPNGDGFQYVFANYISAGGETLEGAGVSPDIEVIPTRPALLQGYDLVLEAAIAWIQEQK